MTEQELNPIKNLFCEPELLTETKSSTASPATDSSTTRATSDIYYV